MNESVLKGISASPGVAIGSAFILDKQDFVISPRAIMEQEVPIEIARFYEAVAKTRAEILQIKQRVTDEMEGRHAQIFDAHLLILDDQTLIDEVNTRITKEKQAAEYVFYEVLQNYIKAFAKIEDEYLRERMGDINDVGRRVLKHLVEENRLFDFENIKEELIVLSYDLSPSDSISMYHKNIIAFATDIGGRTSHTAILAKSLGVPAVVGLKDATLQVHNQDKVIIDGCKGLVICHPTKETLQKYECTKARISKYQSQFDDVRDLPSETLDHASISLFANLELPSEVATVLSTKAAGIGLYRTEYFYMNREDLPTEEEQFCAYKKVVEELAPLPVTIRTLDLGGDKFISSLQIPKDMYPFLGWRAIRFCLERPDIFKTQLRAILRASSFGNVRIMYPMITGLGELRQANVIINEVKADLKAENIAFAENIPVGVMIEVPAAAVVADMLAREADFFSIGTNDLVQYCLAVDRVNVKTTGQYEPNHPAVIRLIKQTIDAANNNGIDVSLCGEMSSDPLSSVLLLGLGLTQFSMSPMSVLLVKRMIRSVNMSDAKQLAEEVLQLSTGEQIEDLVRDRVSKLVPNFFNLEHEEA